MFKNHGEFLKLYRYDSDKDEYSYHIKAEWRADGDIVKIDEWVCVSKEAWETMRKGDQNEYKRGKREERCLVPGFKGRLVRCDERNDCNACPYLDAKHSQPGERAGGTVSLELAAESGLQFPDDFDICAALEKEELYSALHSAIQLLDEESKHIILLYYGGLSERKIAEIMGKPQSSISYRKKKAFAELRTYLEEYWR